MGMYRRLYPAIEEKILKRIEERGQIHGSAVRDLFISFFAGRFFVDDHAEKILTELVEEGVLSHCERPEPTHSQGAFLGLQFPRGVGAMGWIPGLRETFTYWKKGDR